MKLFKNISYILLLILLLSACSEETIIPEPEGIYGELKSGINQQAIQGKKVYLLNRSVSIGPHGPWGKTISDIKYIYMDSAYTDGKGKFSFEKELEGKIGIYISDPQNTYSLADSTDHTLVNMDSTNYKFIELESVPTPTRDSFEIELEIYNVLHRTDLGRIIEEDYFLTHPIKISSFRVETQWGLVWNRILLKTKSIISNSSGIINVKFKFIKGHSDIFYSLNNTMIFITHVKGDINDIDSDIEYIYISLPLSDTLSYRKYSVNYYDIDEYYGGVSFSE